ncbi:MAG: GFA family protein [Alphaproteobacteria bacterium]|tara:strand:- start:22 stop:438 length:417 start_codon:yes stop_codon:yes gene_type:complete
MSENQIQTGGCLCGNIKYKFNREDVVSAGHCHCKDCQKITGSGKATIVFIPTKSLKITNNYKVYSVIGNDGTNVHRGFCPNCGSPVISYVTEQPDLRFIKAGSLDDSSWINIESSFWSISANKWDPVNENIPCFEQNP